MKPNFALDLSHEGIGLLHRNTGSKDGWTLVGEVALDDPEMADKLEMLRKTAADLEKGGVETKLIIPNSQILYTELDAPGGDDIAREVQIRAALEGMTPYEVGELVFDWRRAKGTKVKVAVVARETLQEAEQFAKDHRMNPVSFVARPEKGFKGEAFFGMATGASALLGPGNSVEPDKEPVPKLSRLGDSEQQDDSPETTEPAEPLAEPEDAKAAPEPAPDAPSETEAAETEADKTEAPETQADEDRAEPDSNAPTLPPSPAPEEEDDEDARVAALLADVPEPDLSDEEKPAARAETEEAAEKAAEDTGAKKTPPDILAPFPPMPDEDEAAAPGKRPLPPPPPRRKLPPIPAPSVSARPATEPPVARKTTGKAADPGSAGKGSLEPPIAPPEAKPTEAAASDPAPAFASRRQHTPPPDAPASAELTAERPQKPASNGRLSGLLAAGPAKADDRAKTDSVADKARVANGGMNGVLGNIAAKATRGLARRGKATAPQPGGANSRAAPAPLNGTRPPRPAATAIAPAPDALPGATATGATASEAERLTMFGARPSQREAVGGKPKYLGLVLTLILLLVMAAIALASVFLFVDDNAATPGQDAPSPFAAAAVPEALLPGTAEDSASPVPPSTEPPPPAGGTGSTLAALPTAPESPGASGQIDTASPAATPTDPAPPPAADAPAQSPDPMTEEAAQTRYAALGIWERAPDSPPEPQGSRIDDLYIASIDPKVAGNDAVALPQAPTAASDQRPATPMPPPPPGADFALGDDGLVTPSPEGTLAPSGILVFSGKPPVVPPPRPGTLRPDIPNTDALRAFRPKPRPISLIEDNERANNAGNSLLELAAFRPKPRPATVQVAPDAVDQAVAEASAATATDQAVAASPLPGHRPGNFSTIVASARTASGSDGSSVVAASAAATTTPAIPTRASVARQATMTNAIRLNKLTLIGIYGSSSSRRALVRLSNGRYRKVSVGDRLNGGKVVSITESRLIYTKSGRNHTLDLIPLG